MNSLLLALEDSTNVESALRFLRRLPLTKQTQIIVLTVVENIPSISFLKLLSEQECQRLEEWNAITITRANHLVEKAADLLASLGFNARTEIRKGNPAKQILASVHENNVDLLVLGDNNGGKNKKFLAGTTAEKIVTYANCSVVIARERMKPEAARSDNSYGVVFAYDESEQAKAAAKEFLSLEWKDVRVTILSILTIGTTLFAQDLAEKTSEGWQAYKKKVGESLQLLAGKLRPSSASVTTHLVEGGTDPCDEILNFARQKDADMIIVGATGRSGIQQLLLGSVAKIVVENASCSVWVSRG